MTLQMLDVPIGLLSLYLMFSTVASAASEMIEAWIRKRGTLLERGIGEMFEQVANGFNREQLVSTFYSDPGIYSLFRGDYRPGMRKLPQYIAPERFAGTLLTLAHTLPQFRAVCDAILKRAGNSGEAHIDRLAAMATSDLQLADDMAAKYRQQIADFYTENMARVSSWYRSHVQWLLFAIGFALAVIFNLDTLHVVRALSSNPELRRSVVDRVLTQQRAQPAAPTTPAAPCDDACTAARLEQDIRAQLALAEQSGLPIGWTPAEVIAPVTWSEVFSLRVGGYWAGKLLGWLITALAICQGAPFWFDLLNKLTNLRSAVKSPEPEAARK